MLHVKPLSPLATVACGIALLLSAPIISVIWMGTHGTLDVWQHLWDTVLSDYIIHSLLLMAGVTIGTLLLGVPTAWLSTRYQFPLRNISSLLLMLPMAMPAYIIAYTYTGLLDFAGPIQTWIRHSMQLNYGEYWFINIQSVGGAVWMLSLVLYPYVFLLARAGFMAQPAHLHHASRILGHSNWQTFFKITLPLARPSIVAGLMLVLMETLSDYGTVQYFGVSTFTTGIFRTYYGFGDENAASQLAVMLLMFVLLLYSIEKYSRRQVGYYATAEMGHTTERIQLKGYKGKLALLLCLLPPLFGFVLPSILLLVWSFDSMEWRDPAFFTLAFHSFSLALAASLLAAVLALILGYALRLHKTRPVQTAVQFASMGYAMPGTIIAIGVMTLLSWLDHTLVSQLEAWLDLELGLLFSGTLFALLMAYSIRFLTVSIGAINSGLLAIKPSIDASARLLGRTPLQMLKQIHIPLLRSSVFTALLIVFVDVMKELPATLILRPFNFNTLAVRAYELASDERLYDAAPASLTIVLVGLLPVMLLNHSLSRRG